MIVHYPVPFVNNLLSSLSTYSSAAQGFFVQKSLRGTALYGFITMKDVQKTKEIGI